MELAVVDRFLLLGILPPEGDITTLRIVRDLRRDLGFSEEELEAFKIKLHKDTGQVQWDVTTATSKEVPVGPKAHSLIAEALKKLSKEKKLRADHLDLYDRFVEED